MIKELENNLNNIPEEFAIEKYEIGSLGDNETESSNKIFNREILLDRKQYADNIINDTPTEKGQEWECGYYRGYNVCVNDLKNILSKNNKTEAIDLIELIMHDLDITKGDISNNFND